MDASGASRQEPPPRIETTIATLGEVHWPWHAPGLAFADDVPVDLIVGRDVCDTLRKPLRLAFEVAGPRRTLYADPATVRCAIATCGGLCPGLNDVIRSIVHTACNTYHVREVLGFRHGLAGIAHCEALPPLPLVSSLVENISELGGSFLGTSRGAQDIGAILDALERSRVRCLFLIGGNGTMKAALAIERAARRRAGGPAVIGIPKTIDNDIPFVPQSFGFETAVERAAEAIRCAWVEAVSVRNGIGVVKLMGRESGFIAAHAANAQRNADFVLIPEVPFVLDGPGGLLQALERRLAHQAHALLVVAEGAGRHLFDTSPTRRRDSSGNRVLPETAALLMDRIAAHLAARSIPHNFKYIDPSYLIRSVPANPADKIYCNLLGQYAVHAAMCGRTGMVVARLMDTFVHLPLELVCRKRRVLNLESPLWCSIRECMENPAAPAHSAKERSAWMKEQKSV